MFETLPPEDLDLVLQACEVIKTTNRASVSTVQRRMRISYTDAAKAMDILEEAGVIGPPVGALSRTICMEKLEEALNPSGQSANIEGEGSNNAENMQMTTVKCTKCHMPMQTTKSPGELEDCPKCRAVFEIPFNQAKFYHHAIPGMQPGASENSSRSHVGILVLVIGILLMGYFGLFYDTTVYASDGYVHNVGLMNNRMTGLIFGGVIAVIGAILMIGKK